MGRKAGDSTMYEYLSIYIGAPIKNLDAYLTNSMSPSLAVKSTQWGDMTLASTPGLVPQILRRTLLTDAIVQPFNGMASWQYLHVHSHILRHFISSWASRVRCLPSC